ncbi:unnamed protein product, partial [Rotaria sp. Silwood2]
MSETSPEV